MDDIPKSKEQELKFPSIIRTPDNKIQKLSE